MYIDTKTVGRKLFVTTRFIPVSYTHLDVYKRQELVARGLAEGEADRLNIGIPIEGFTANSTFWKKQSEKRYSEFPISW